MGKVTGFLEIGRAELREEREEIAKAIEQTQATIVDELLKKDLPEGDPPSIEKTPSIEKENFIISEILRGVPGETDSPFGQRLEWINAQRAEARREGANAVVEDVLQQISEQNQQWKSRPQNSDTTRYRLDSVIEMLEQHLQPPPDPEDA